MNICLAGISSCKFLENKYYNCKYMLESFYYFKDWETAYIESCDLFLLDSGAFTFMNSAKSNVNFYEYAEKYANFINKHNIKHFFELDIDSVVGIEKVEELRDLIETKTGKKSIPVWHKSRGKDYFISMCKNYDYVAIGGIVTGEIKSNEYKYFKWFIDTAHKYNCKIHGLGFTYPQLLAYLNFDSVDSLTWQCASRFGEIQKFNGFSIDRIVNKNKNKTKIDAKILIENDYCEWIKFQNFASKYL